MAAIFLDEDEIQAVTHKKRPSAQHRVLNEMGVTHKVRPDGSIIVLRSHIEQQLGGSVAGSKKKDPVPNWEAMRNA